MSDLGDTVWVWQSQQEDGSWSTISMGYMNARDVPIGTGPRYTDAQMALVLIHRNREIATGPLFLNAVESHRAMHNQPVRLARFELAEVEEAR